MANITLLSMYNRLLTQVTSSSDYTSTMFLEDAHIITQDIWSEVCKKKLGNSNWNIWYTDTVSLQDEYTKPLVSSTNIGAEYIENISVSYDSLIYTNTGKKQYIVCTPATDVQIANWEYYLENQPNTQPIYFERDKSVFIAPDPRSTEV